MFPTTFVTPSRTTLMLVESKDYSKPPRIHMVHAWGHSEGGFRLIPFIADKDGTLVAADVDRVTENVTIGHHVDRLTQTAIAAAKEYRKQNPAQQFSYSDERQVDLDRGFWNAEVDPAELDRRTCLPTTTSRHFGRS
ncbi:hypothetical protein SEA_TROGGLEHUMPER_15 [Rhodococcus phage Trogglehumper]|uniref:Uncharacterized protein n=1 Tax=Rhodococcus phage Trogglehumper TaxID=3038381 RepID=A0AAF0GJZ5_9CAUD|nr:hypothetical protein SEA_TROGGLEHUMPER_15 [Rhodococcus phage Trogglehumper]